MVFQSWMRSLFVAHLRFLSHLDHSLRHLDISKCDQLVHLIQQYPCLFSDVPTETHLIEYDIDVRDSKPIRQCFYHVHPEKQQFLEAEIRNMMDNGIAVPSSSS